MLTEKTPDDPRILQTIGIRSAGALGDVVMLGGPVLSHEGGINLFAFHAQTGDYLGSMSFPGYTNIRKWLVVDDILYTAVGNKMGGGNVVRWTGQLEYLPAGEPNLYKLFQFEVVGTLDGDGAELAYHENRLFISTWSGPGRDEAGIWMGPVIPEGGLTSDYDQEGLWVKVWRIGDYEPDPVTASTYSSGALASFEGYLYWGTMHVPGVSTMAHFQQYGFPGDPNNSDEIMSAMDDPNNSDEIISALLGTFRTISIFRGRYLDTEDPEIELLYGMSKLPAYIPPGSDPAIEPGRWELVDNTMGLDPLWGQCGFGNIFNGYTWTMSVYDGQLFVGTMDWSYLIGETILRNIFGPNWVYVRTIFPIYSFGADLYRFCSSDTPAIPESLSGVGNYTSYGIRTMVSDDALYLGMANPMNLLTNPHDFLPEGGWELIKLTPKYWTTTIVDTVRPEVRSILASPNKLWPTPCLGLFKKIAVSVDLEDVCDANPTGRIVSVTSNQRGLPWTNPDWIIMDERNVYLRAERGFPILGNRVYTINVECTDASDNRATASTGITVGYGLDRNFSRSRNIGSFYTRSGRRPRYVNK
ncbi:MAG: hypothetical protein ACMUIA_06590 [bacterium]